MRQLSTARLAMLLCVLGALFLLAIAADVIPDKYRVFDTIAAILALATLGLALVSMGRCQRPGGCPHAPRSRPDGPDPARVDALTGLQNRAAFLEALDAALDRHYTDGRHIGVFIVDIDRFKQINAVHGHVTADSVLVEVARRLKSLDTDQLTVARLGTDEFVLLVSNDMIGTTVERLADRIIDALQTPIGTQHGSLRVSATIGIATSEYQHLSGDGLLRAADIALGAAKREARGNYRQFEANMAEALRMRSTLERDLRRALTAGEIVPYYQPLIALDTGRLSGFEVLARWNHPRYGLMAPAAFIPLAEEIGRIGDLFRQLLAAACADARQWPSEMGISMNVSPTQFADPELASQILMTLHDTGIAPKRLELEITESALVDKVSSAHLTLTTLREVGVTVALDDFGTGYSNLRHLSDLPVDRVKIDRLFVERARQDIENWKIVRAIVQFAHALNLETTAEGIEIAEAADILRDVGCDVGQGYFFGRPQSAAVTSAWLTELVRNPIGVLPRLAL
ncbi:EAL domain-containing protein [Kaistia dalseonensis]|uniref:Diguanylate cyclase (GGDEF)-like protein n=1 Tax=Kaistia dalseonensis TaxID=410840 RepID=A0ABU0H5M0_9HYPH|nr:EAL domain-containing protein [Kaistia dalseonensis]MCX5494172.1 EAL domain-containing protein [Kaistia dalseonensis]MDQ0436751.1 diguanylate cyclase (GGDEF)-like protein [Kaistia dalseonensis]